MHQLAQAFEGTRARDLGFKGDSTFAEIIRIYLEHDMPSVA
jgi:hypothetical protein